MTSKRAFVGLCGPLGYDYRNQTARLKSSNNSSPNPVLEDVSGLAVCYDELIFLSREFCPADMRDLDFVKFISDDPQLLARAATAYSQYEELFHEYSPQHQFDFKEFESLVKLMTGDGYMKSFVIDNHTNGISLDERTRLLGNAANLRNPIIDVGIATSLDLRNLDVIVNSVAIRAIIRETDNQKNDSLALARWKLEVTDRLVSVQTPNYLGPKGAYHESLSELRHHSRIEDFRKYIGSIDKADQDASEAAKEISALAEDYIDEAAERYLKGRNRFVAFGIPVVSYAADSALPGSGRMIKGLAGALEWLERRRFVNRVSWAPFVVKAQRLSRNQAIES